MKRETVLPAPLIFPPPTEARGASPADALAGLPVPAAFLTADAGLSGANREWIQLLEPATREGEGERRRIRRVGDVRVRETQTRAVVCEPRRLNANSQRQIC